jgi:hypothetical protein
MAAAVPGVWPELLPGEHHDAPEGRTAVFVVAFLVCRAIASRSTARDGQVVAFWPATQSIMATPWVVSLFVPETIAYWLWGVSIVVDVAFSMLGARNPRAIEQMTERARQRQEQNERQYQQRLARAIQRGISPERLQMPEPTLLSVAHVERGHLGRTARPVRHHRARRGAGPGGRREHRDGVDLGGDRVVTGRVPDPGAAVATDQPVRVHAGIRCRPGRWR